MAEYGGVLKDTRHYISAVMNRWYISGDRVYYSKR